MKRYLLSARFLGQISIAALCVAMPIAANAQDAPAAPTPAATNGTEEIVVTANKGARAQTVHDTPFSVTALGPEQVEQAHIQSIGDLTNQAPNVYLNTQNASSGVNNFAIRGMGVYSTIPTSTSTVGVFVDGVYVGIGAGAALRNTFDLEGIEVLRGPQGLLFGRNVTAGALVLRTTEPSDQLHINARAAVESGPNEIFSGSISGPLTSDGKLSGKIAMLYSDDRGYFTNLFNGNKHFGKDVTAVFRGAIKWKTTDTFTNVLRVEHGTENGDGVAFQNHVVYSPNTFDFSIDTEGFNKQQYDNATLESRVDVGFGNGQIINIAGFRAITSRSLIDADSTPVQTVNATLNIRHHQFSDELRYAGDFGFLSSTVGLYYYADHLDYVEQRDLSNQTVHRIGGAQQTSQTYAIFSSFDIKLPAKLTLNLGARYTSEHKSASTLLIASGNNCSQANITCTGFTFSDAHTWNAFTPKIGLRWDPTPATNVYAFWTRGYRSGGYNARVTAASLTPPGPYDQEVVNSYEIGLKQDLFGRRLRLGLAGFRNGYKNLQRDLAFTDPVIGINQTTFNTADATIWGVEAEATAKIGSDFTFQANGGYLHNKLDRLLRGLGPTGQILPGQLDLKIPFAPEWTYGISVRYSPDTPVGQFDARIAFNHVDRAFSNDLNLNRLNPINNLDVDLTLKFHGSGLSVSVYTKNLLNRVYFSENNPIGTAGTVAPLSKGRVLGAELRFTY